MSIVHNKLVREGISLFFFIFLMISPIGIISSDSQRTNSYSQLTLQAISPKFDFSTYLGGIDMDDGHGIAIASDGSCYITGQTSSSDFPIMNAYNGTYGGMYDAFVTKFSASGSLIWSTFLGGNELDQGAGIAAIANGGCYVVGNTESNNFPTLDAYNSTFNGMRDIFITKFSAQGSLLWSTYLGGNSSENCLSVSTADDGSCFLTGYTSSNNFPVLNAFNDTFGGVCDTFVAKFSTSGTLLWSTYLGGNETDYGYDIAVAGDGSCYLIGVTDSSDFPIVNAFDSTFNGGEYYGDVFVTKFSTNGSLLWSTYLGGTWDDSGYGIAVGSDGDCFLTGVTESSDFPVKNAFDDSYNGVGEHHTGDAFVSKFSTNGTLLWSTYIGGNVGDVGLDIAVTNDDRCYIVGATSSTNFPTLLAINTTLNGNQDLFIAEFSSEYILLWSTYLGGDMDDYGWGIAVTNNGLCYLAGTTTSENFPTINSLDSSYNGNYDAFIMKISRTSPQQLSSNGYYFFLIFILIIPIVIIIVKRKK
ncbi:MAG TPA: SBBP repeat-containing protein [Candidatus Bathyarchaeia archaeon]|nr:SBBP repeat-containing protein [Candidatus Bathyarchaeia archaeon]